MTTQTITHTQGMTIKTSVKVTHKQKQSTSKRKVLIEAKKDRVLDEICFLMFKNERANKKKADRLAYREAKRNR